jgi:hypothetical protein
MHIKNNFYYLKIQRNTIEDIPPIKSPIIANIK